MGLKHQQAGKSPHPVNIGKPRSGRRGRSHGRVARQYTADLREIRVGTAAIGCPGLAAPRADSFRARIVEKRSLNGLGH